MLSSISLLNDELPDELTEPEEEDEDIHVDQNCANNPIIAAPFVFSTTDNSLGIIYQVKCPDSGSSTNENHCNKWCPCKYQKQLEYEQYWANNEQSGTLVGQLSLGCQSV